MNRYLKNSALLLSICLMSSALVASSTATPRQLSGFMPQTTSASSTLSATPALTSTSSSSLWSWFRWPSLPSFSWSAPSRETTYNIALASLLAATAYGGWRYYQVQQAREQEQARVSHQTNVNRENALRRAQDERQVAEREAQAARIIAAQEQAERLKLELALEQEQAKNRQSVPPAYDSAQFQPPPYSAAVQQAQPAPNQQAEQQRLPEVEQDQQALPTESRDILQLAELIENRHQYTYYNSSPYSSEIAKDKNEAHNVPINIENAKLKGFKIVNNTRRANLSHAVLIGANLEDAQLPNVKLHRANLRGAILRNANLSQRYAIPNDTMFPFTNEALSLAELVNADLRGANLTNVDLSYADLTGADFRGATLTGAKLSGALIKNAKFDDAIGLTKKQLNSARQK